MHKQITQFAADLTSTTLYKLRIIRDQQRVTAETVPVFHRREIINCCGFSLPNLTHEGGPEYMRTNEISPLNLHYCYYVRVRVCAS